MDNKWSPHGGAEAASGRHAAATERRFRHIHREVVMAPRREIHVTPHGDGKWQAKQGGATRASVVGDTKAAVMKEARDIARNQHEELVEHGKDGRIQNPNSYGHDPHPPVDKK